MCDAIIVGCGLSGSVVARHLADTMNRRVLMLEKRNHIGGNMYDYYDEHGILVHKYGPHTFHTNNQKAYEYMLRFAQWQAYRLECMAEIDGIVTPTPFNYQTIDDFYPPEEGKTLKAHLERAFPDQETETVLELLGHADPIIRKYAQFLFDKDYGPYTAKQWGIPPSEVDPSVLRRVPVRFSYRRGYFEDTYQIMPQITYHDFFKKLLHHPNIEVRLNVDALAHLSVADDGASLNFDGRALDVPVIYTGPLDALFGYCYGRLPYRSLRFDWRHEDIDSFQAAPVVAYPQKKGYTRITEYKKLPVQAVHGTSYAVEYPLQYDERCENEPYYPTLTEESQKHYEGYARLANEVSGLYCCGRLADFKYYNMDQALIRAVGVCTSFLQ